MRYKGLLGSVSTSALLVLAAVAVLSIASAIVAFRGWPGPTGETPTETFLLEDAEPTRVARPAPELVLGPASAEPTDGGGSERAPGEGPGDSAAVSGAPDAADSSAPAAAAVAGPAAPTSAPAPAPDGGATTVPAGPSGGSSTPGPVDRVTGLVEEGADPVGPVTDRVGRLASPVTDPVEGLVGGAAGSADDLVGGR